MENTKTTCLSTFQGLLNFDIWMSFQKPTEVSQSTPTLISIRNNGPLNICWLVLLNVFWRLFLQNKICWILNELNIWAKVYHIWKMEVQESTIVEITCRWSYYFMSLNIIKNSSKLDNTIFWKPQSKEISGKSLKFFGTPTTIWRPCKFFAKLNGNHLLMANIFKLHKCQTFVLLKMHNMIKIRFFNNKFNLGKCLVYDKRAVKNAIF